MRVKRSRKSLSAVVSARENKENASVEQIRELVMYYFAYGSNLSKRQMALRCPDARPKFRAILPDYQLIFSGWSSRWGGAVASIKPRKDSNVIGGVYDISDTDLALLDEYEGYPTFYDRVKVTIIAEGGGVVEAIIYVKAKAGIESPPSERYLLIIQEGYRDWGLDPAPLPITTSSQLDQP